MSRTKYILNKQFRNGQKRHRSKLCKHTHIRTHKDKDIILNIHKLHDTHHQYSLLDERGELVLVLALDDGLFAVVGLPRDKNGLLVPQAGEVVHALLVVLDL